MKRSIRKVAVLSTAILYMTGVGSFLQGCKEMIARSPDDKPMVIYGPLPEPKEPPLQGPQQPMQEKNR